MDQRADTLIVTEWNSFVTELAALFSAGRSAKEVTLRMRGRVVRGTGEVCEVARDVACGVTLDTGSYEVPLASGGGSFVAPHVFLPLEESAALDLCAKRIRQPIRFEARLEARAPMFTAVRFADDREAQGKVFAILTLGAAKVAAWP